MRDFSAAIFDLDGTLIESMGVWEKIDINFLAERGLSVPENYIEKITPMSFTEAARYTKNLFGLNESQTDIIGQWNRMAVHEYRNNIRLKNNAAEYLKELKCRNVKLGVATALPPALYEPCLDSNGIYDLFDAICSTGQVQQGKEFPDIFLFAAEKLKTLPEACIVFEDILPAVLSAKNAGMTVYGVFDKYSEDVKSEIMDIADGYIYDFKDAP